MNCPRCQAPLNISERQGVEIDTCSACRGVWLDRGELDKIIGRYQVFERDNDDRDDDDDRHPRRPRNHDYPPRRRSFWQELFD